MIVMQFFRVKRDDMEVELFRNFPDLIKNSIVSSLNHLIVGFFFLSLKH